MFALHGLKIIDDYSFEPKLIIRLPIINIFIANSTMATILPVLGKHPQMGADCFIAPNATIVGDVVMGDECSVWFNAVIRGDVHYIKIGNKVNIQDGAIIHCTYQKNPTEIGNRVSIGHNAMVDGCIVHSNSIIAAGAVLLEGTVVESGTIYAGVPAKKVKDLSPDMVHGEIDRIANNYVKYASWFKDYNHNNFLKQ